MSKKRFFISRRIATCTAAVLAIIAICIAGVALAKVSCMNQEFAIQTTEQEYNVLCLVSQMVGENITEKVLDVVATTDDDVLSAVFNLYPKEYADALSMMYETDEVLRMQNLFST